MSCGSPHCSFRCLFPVSSTDVSEMSTALSHYCPLLCVTMQAVSSPSYVVKGFLDARSTWRRGQDRCCCPLGTAVFFQRPGTGSQRTLSINMEEAYGLGRGWLMGSGILVSPYPLTPTTTTSLPCNDLCGKVTWSWLPESRDRRRATARRTDHFPIDPALPGPSLSFNIL